MKDYKRAYRRYMKQVKFVKRINQWFPINKPLSFYEPNNESTRFVRKNRVDVIEEVLKGECFTFLRTTSRPCNCYMCSYLKYKRTPKQNVDRQIWEAINE